MWCKLYETVISSGQSYSFNFIPLLMFSDAHVKLFQHKGLASFDHWMYPFVNHILDLGNTIRN